MSSTLENTISAIEEALKVYSELFVHINKNNGTLSLPRQFKEFYTKVEQPPWASYYESQQKLDTIPFLCFFEPSDIKELADNLKRLSTEEADILRSEMEELAIREFKDMDFEGFDFEFPSKREIEEYLRTASSEQQEKDLVTAYFFFTAFITQVFQFIALVTHGRTMHELVQAAKDGDDIAFCHAVQIDRTVLFAIPYFQKRLIQLQIGNEKTLLQSLGRSIQGQPYGTKYKYPELWLVFSLLHRAELLKPMSLDDLLDLCLRLKVYKGDNTKAIGKRKSEFLKRQRRVI